MFFNYRSTNTSVNIEAPAAVVVDNEDEAAKAVRSIQTILGHNDLELQVSGQEKLALRTVTSAAVQVIFDEIDPHYFSDFKTKD